MRIELLLLRDTKRVVDCSDKKTLLSGKDSETTQGYQAIVPRMIYVRIYCIMVRTSITGVSV